MCILYTTVDAIAARGSGLDDVPGGVVTPSLQGIGDDPTKFIWNAAVLVYLEQELEKRETQEIV